MYYNTRKTMLQRVAESRQCVFGLLTLLLLAFANGARADELTLNDGTTTNDYVPIYGYWVDNKSKSQFIIPAASLDEIAGGTISKMTFYTSNASISWGNAQFEVYLAEVDYTSLSALVDWTSLVKVRNAASLSVSNNQMVVEFDNNYQYSGSNLLVGILETTSGSYSSSSWFCVIATGASF